jgi:hypothetical protein
MFDPVSLAAAAIGLLVPFLKKLGHKTLERVSDDLADAADAYVQGLYERVKAKLVGDEYTAGLLKGVEAQPDNQARQANLQTAWPRCWHMMRDRQRDRPAGDAGPAGRCGLHSGQQHRGGRGSRCAHARRRWRGRSSAATRSLSTASRQARQVHCRRCISCPARLVTSRGGPRSCMTWSRPSRQGWRAGRAGGAGLRHGWGRDLGGERRAGGGTAARRLRDRHCQAATGRGDAVDRSAGLTPKVRCQQIPSRPRRWRPSHVGVRAS